MHAFLLSNGYISGVRVRGPRSWREIVRRDPCPYCVVFPDDRRRGDRAMNLEHVVPVAAGGRDHAENLVCAHRVCNSQRGSRGLLMFFLERQFVSEYCQGRTRTERHRILAEWRAYFCPAARCAP